MAGWPDRLGCPGAARAVGTALGRNPLPLIVPCHRVVCSSGRPGGFSATGGSALKRLLLEHEGVGFDSQGRVVSMSRLLKNDQFLFQFSVSSQMWSLRRTMIEYALRMCPMDIARLSIPSHFVNSL